MKTKASDFLPFVLDNISFLESSHEPLWHPLGFVSCVIKESLGEYAVRIHFWPKGERRVKNPDWPIHTHVYHLSSFVLSGCVRDLQYEIVSGNEYSIYKVRYYQGGSEILKTEDTTNIVVTLDELRKTRQEYCVKQGTFHQTKVPIDDSAVTLVALTDYADEAPQVLGYSEENRYPYDRKPYDKKRFWKTVKQTLQKFRA